MGPDLEKSKVEIGALTRKDNGSVTHNQEDSLVQCMSNYEDNNFHEEVMNDSLAKMSAETEDVEVNIVECTKSGKNVVHVLDIITDLLGTPSAESIARIGNEKARKYLNSMRKKQPVPLSKKIPNADPLALKILERLLAFDPKDRPSAEEALADPYFYHLANKENEPSRQPISKLELEFERRNLTKDDVRELIYREILEYHPEMLKE